MSIDKPHNRQSDKRQTYILLFSLGTGSGDVSYYLLDPLTNNRILPKANNWFVEQVQYLLGYRVVVMENYLYIIGGKKWFSGMFSDAVWRYDPCMDTWAPRANMGQARCRFGLAVLGKRIYVTGGEISRGRVTNLVEVYDPETDKWTSLQPLPLPRVDHACCALDNVLYVSGGVSQLTQRCSDIFWKYQPGTDNEWSLVPGENILPQEREKHLMIPLAGKIYFIGGRGFDQETLREKEEARVCSYDCRPRKITKDGDNNEDDDDDDDVIDAWDLGHPNMFHPRSCAGACVLGRSIFVLGGRNITREESVVKVDCYHTRRRKWKEPFSLPQGPTYSNVDCCYLQVPETNQAFSNLNSYLYTHWLMW